MFFLKDFNVRYLILVQVIGTFFMDIVNASHSYATGGTSAGEFWY